MVAVTQDEIGGQGEFVAGQQSGLIRDAQGAVLTAAQGIQQGGDDGGIPVDGQVGLGQAGGAFDADAKPGIACRYGVCFRGADVRELGIAGAISRGLVPPGEDDGGDPGQVLFLAAVADAGHRGVGLPCDQGLQEFTAGIDARRGIAGQGLQLFGCNGSMFDIQKPGGDGAQEVFRAMGRIDREVGGERDHADGEDALRQATSGIGVRLCY